MMLSNPKILRADNKIVSLEIKCPDCKIETILVASIEGFNEYRRGALIQNAFPTLSAVECDMLLTGMCYACQEKFYAEAHNDEREEDSQ